MNGYVYTGAACAEGSHHACRTRNCACPCHRRDQAVNPHARGSFAWLEWELEEVKQFVRGQVREVRTVRRELERYTTARLLEEWHEEDGPALWWHFPIAEPPYVGTPGDEEWPGDEHCTHWTPIPLPGTPAEGERDA